MVYQVINIMNSEVHGFKKLVLPLASHFFENYWTSLCHHFFIDRMGIIPLTLQACWQVYMALYRKVLRQNCTCIIHSYITRSCLTLVIPWTVAGQVPLSMGFSRQEHWSGLPFPTFLPLGIYLKKIKTLIQKDMYPMFIPALFTIAKIWRQPKFPLIG